MSASATSVLCLPAIAPRSRAECRAPTSVISQPAACAAWPTASHVIPVGSATTSAGAYADSRSVNWVMPASVGGTAKSSGAVPRTATRWSATIAVSIPIVMSVALECIEGSSHEHSDADLRVQTMSTPRTNSSWESPRPRPTAESGLSPNATRHTPGRPTRRPTHACELMRCPSRTPLGGGSTNSLNRVCSRDEPRRQSGQRAWLAQRISVTAGIPPEITLRDHRPAHDGTPHRYKRLSW